MGGGSEALEVIRRRLARVERAVADLQGVHPGDDNRDNRAEAALHRETLRVLTARSRERGERLILIASADGDTGAMGGPDAVREFATEDMEQPLVALGSAVGHATRVKLLRALVVRGECAIAELAEASGASGGNLYQHLNELHRANLIDQPGRGRYRLTENGQHAVDVLFWCALQVRRPMLDQHSRWFTTGDDPT